MNESQEKTLPYYLGKSKVFPCSHVVDRKYRKIALIVIQSRYKKPSCISRSLNGEMIQCLVKKSNTEFLTILRELAINLAKYLKLSDNHKEQAVVRHYTFQQKILCYNFVIVITGIKVTKNKNHKIKTFTTAANSHNRQIIF